VASRVGALALTGAVAVIIPASAPVNGSRADAPPHQPHGAREPSALDLGGAKSANSADFAPPKATVARGSSRAHSWPQKPRRHGTLGARRARRAHQRRCRSLPWASESLGAAGAHGLLGDMGPWTQPPGGPRDSAARPTRDPAAQIGRSGRGLGDSGVRPGPRSLETLSRRHLAAMVRLNTLGVNC
jgi:hypothetical protein